jgi:hypothetical protein
MKIDPNDPAFPVQESMVSGSTGEVPAASGLPIRLHLAAMNMASLAPHAADYERFKHMAFDALQMADALIAEYNRTEEDSK